MKCSFCGNEIPDNSKFCEVCGHNTATAQRKRKRRSFTALIVIILVLSLGIYVAYMLAGGFNGGGSGTPGWIGGNTGSNGYSQETGQAGESLGLTGLRDHYTQLKGNGEDTVTIMVYVCASDLESKYGCATDDLSEMIGANVGDGVNIIVQTGGCSNWQNEVVSNSRSERYLLNGEGITNLNCGLKQLRMTDGDTLRDFIKYCAKNYPADRYFLIMWDHGGGSLGGFGYDENYPNAASMSLADMDSALNAAGVKFDVVGFDACLMATVETAYMLEEHADYLIASVETEPGTGWYYTDWLKALSKNTSIPTGELGQLIVDDYISSTGRTDEATLSVVELREMGYVYEKLCEFFANADESIRDYEFRGLSAARSSTKSYGEGGFDQIDLVAFAKSSGLDGADELAAAVNSAVIYSGSRNVSMAGGLAVYFPYEYLEYYQPMQKIINSVGMDESYTRFFSDFVTVMAGGQLVAEERGETDTPDYSECDWFDGTLIDSYGEFYENYSYNELELIDKGDYYALRMTDEQWALITSAELQVFLDDNEGGLIDLGSDNVPEFDSDGDLMVDFDYTWVSVEGVNVAYYCLYEQYTSDDNWYTYGYSPAVLNDELVDIIIRWDNENPTGFVVGARMSYSDDTGIAAKGVEPLKDGDKLRFVIDYYDFDGNYLDSYFYGDEITVNGELTVSYEDVGDYDTYIFYIIKDIYGAVYTTESVKLYVE